MTAAPSSAALKLQNYEAEDNHRFYVDPGGGPAKSFIGDPFDSSGVGLTTSESTASDIRWLTMISPSYGVTAYHFRPGNGTSIRFYYSDNPSGTFEDKVVSSSQRIGGSDLSLVKLTTQVSASVRKYSVLDFSNNGSYNNLNIYTYGKDSAFSDTSQRLGRNNIDPGSIGNRTLSGITGRSYTYDYDAVGGQGDDESLVKLYDSGGPSFAIIDGQFALVGLHWFANSTESGDTFVPFYISDLNTAMVGESVTVVPEPSALLLAALSLLALATGAGRMRRAS